LPFALSAIGMTFAGQTAAQDRELWFDVEAGASQTDNINRSDDTLLDPALDETIYTAGASLRAAQSARTYDLDLTADVRRLVYDDKTFDDETLSRVNGSLLWKLVGDAFAWDFRANHGQQLIDPFEPVTPENREDVTVLTTGPQGALPLGRRSSFVYAAQLTDVSYELRDFNDNQRIGGNLGFERDIAPTRSLSINVGGDRIEYDDDELLAPIDRVNASLGFDADGARNVLRARVGWNEIERDDVKGDGLFLELDWVRRISGQSTFTVNAGSRYSTNGDIFRYNQQLDGSTSRDISDSRDGQVTDDPFQHDNVRVGYNLDLPRTRFSVNADWSREEYDTQTQLNRELAGGRLDLSYDALKNLTLTAGATYVERKYLEVDRTDDDTNYTLGVQFRISRTFSATLRGNRIERSSNTSVNDYEENRVSLVFTWRAYERQ
jgi:outer membrane protein assembly factor BamA